MWFLRRRLGQEMQSYDRLSHFGVFVPGRRRYSISHQARRGCTTRTVGGTIGRSDPYLSHNQLAVLEFEP